MSDEACPVPDGAWLAHLHDAHFTRLVRLAVLLTGDPSTAEDLVQDAFVELHRRRARLSDPDRALGYLHRTVVNRSRSRHRHLSVVRRKQPALLPDHHHDPDAGIRADVIAALASLPRRQREVLTLRYYADLTGAQIAETLGISEGSVKSHTSRGAQTLRAALKEYS